MKKMNNSHKFVMNITEKDMMLLSLIAAAKGISPEKLLECFAHDIVSYFSSTDVSIEEDYLSRWFFGSWFSEDKGYFSFLQYLICSGWYISVITEIKACLRDFPKHQVLSVRKIYSVYKMYCAVNPAHKSFASELRDVLTFERKNKLHSKKNFKRFNDLVQSIKRQELNNKDECGYNGVDFAALR